MNHLVEGLAVLAAGDPLAAALIQGRRQKIIQTLTLYMEEIERFNGAYSLVKVKDRTELVVKHVLDSLAPLGRIAEVLGISRAPPPAETRSLAETRTPAAECAPALRLADAGSGAGFPGIPLALCLPAVRFTLIERMARRAGFLRNTLAVLGLCNAETEEMELEKAPPGRFDMVVFRALSPLTVGWTAKLGRLLKPGGVLAAYKGRRETAEQEFAALAGVPCAAGNSPGRREIVPVSVPFLAEERHMLFQRIA